MGSKLDRNRQPSETAKLCTFLIAMAFAGKSTFKEEQPAASALEGMGAEVLLLAQGISICKDFVVHTMWFQLQGKAVHVLPPGTFGPETSP